MCRRALPIKVEFALTEFDERVFRGDSVESLGIANHLFKLWLCGRRIHGEHGRRCGKPHRLVLMRHQSTKPVLAFVSVMLEK